MNTENIKHIFQSQFDYRIYCNEIVRNIFGCSDINARPELLDTSAEGDRSHYIGRMSDAEGRELGFFYTRVAEGGDVRRKRVGLRKLIAPYVKYDVDAAIAVFDDGRHWRLSYICDMKEGATSAKRFSYVLGDQQGQYNTPVHRLLDLGKLVSHLCLKNIFDAFSVETLSDEFFDEYHRHYDRIVAELGRQGNTGARYHDYVKKMMGRIVFLHFLQKKGWLNGNPYFLSELFFKQSFNRKSDFLEQVLEPLFFGIFNTEAKKRKALFAQRGWDTSLLNEWETLPYLNGGLFEEDEVDKLNIKLPASLFEDLFNFLASYNFTVDENDPDDAEIGIDPEMLGKIFESLLEDNKAKGAFYTPKEIVHYMCKESLIAYLSSIVDGELADAVRQFVEHHELPEVLEPCREAIDTALREVKICDPAIGSGAFPMGLLNELWRCREAIEGDSMERVELKKEIIENNVYGVDIEKGAIDIARLRFWLSIVVDAEKPEPLPNFDYKFMQGNSLIESYKGIDLSRISNRLRGGQSKSPQLLLGLDSDLSRKNLQRLLRDYFSVTDHRQKASMRQAVNDEVKHLIEDFIGGTASDLAKLDPSANQDFFLWHTWFKDIFDKGGFDIVIGNPPYISAPAQIAHETLSVQRENIIKSKKFSSLYQKWDLYIPFIEHGIQLLHDGGVATMIVPYPLTNQTYGKKLRELIMSDYTLFELCDLNGTKIFENAIVSNCIPFVRKVKAPIDSATIISHINEKREIEHAFVKSPADLVPNAKTAVWNVGEEKRDVNRHTGMHALGDYCYISVGMVINADEKTAKGEFQKEDLISLTQDEIHCRAYIEAKDIEKYRIKRVRFLEYNTERCPNKLRRPTFRELYEQPKLMVNRLGQLQVYYDNENLLTSDAMFCCVLWKSIRHVTNKSISASVKRFSTLQRSEMEKLSDNVDLRYLLGILNSRYADVLLTNLRGGDYHIYPEHIRNIPIAPATADQQLPIITLVNRILAAKKSNPLADTTAEEREIDRLVYNLYGLTDEEIDVIEST